MGVPVLILGKSGSGKSRSIKGLANVGLIKVIEKELPFRNNLGFITTSNYDVIKQALLKSQTKSIVIDDAGYLLTNEYLFSSTKGYDKFTDIAVNFYELIRFITTTVPKDKIVYITMHEDEDKKLIISEMKKTIKNDRSKVQIEDFTKLNLMEITRKHINSKKFDSE